MPRIYEFAAISPPHHNEIYLENSCMRHNYSKLFAFLDSKRLQGGRLVHNYLQISILNVFWEKMKKNKKCLELPDLARKLIRKIIIKFFSLSSEFAFGSLRDEFSFRYPQWRGGMLSG